jgi:hypothetical protein
MSLSVWEGEFAFRGSLSGGGVCIYLKCHVNYQKRVDLVPNNIEAVCLEIRQANSQSFIMSCVYRPPNTPVEVQY